MNIFDQYLERIKKILIDLSKNGGLILPDKLDGITTELPPQKFNSDILSVDVINLDMENYKNLSIFNISKINKKCDMILINN